MYVVSKPGLKLGARALRVVEVCKAGGFVRYALEKSYVDGEKELVANRVSVCFGLDYDYRCVTPWKAL